MKLFDTKKPKTSVAVMLLLAICVLIAVFTFSISYPMNFMDLVVVWTFCIGATGIAYMTTVKFHSPLCLTETTQHTTFEGRTEVIHDKEWNAHLGVVFIEGYNAAKRVLSKEDISTNNATTMIITPSPFLIETFANGRFIIVRGDPQLLSRSEAKAFLARPSVKAALGDEVSSATIYWVFESKSLHADQMPADVSTLGDLASTLQQWHGEVAGSGEVFGEEFLRDIKSIRAFRDSPVERMAREKDYKPKEGEEDG